MDRFSDISGVFTKFTAGTKISSSIVFFMVIFEFMRPRGFEWYIILGDLLIFSSRTRREIWKPPSSSSSSSPPPFCPLFGFRALFLEEDS